LLVSARPRLLFVSPRFLLPVDSGGKIRTTQILRGMKGGAFEVVLASPAPPDRAKYSAELAALCDRFVGWPEAERGPLFNLARLRHVLARVPIPVATEASAAADTAIGQELARRPEVALFDFVHAAVWAPADLAVPSVMFTHNVEAEIFARHAQVSADPLRRALWRSQHRKMQRFERETLQRFDTVIAVSTRDAEQFRSDYGVGRDNRIATIGTGVDLEFLSHAPPAAQPHVIFSGSMDWLANIDAIEFFLDSVWPKIAREAPQARMTVVGRAPPAHLIERARARSVNWTFTGYVDDIRPHIRSAAVYVIPLRVGGGTRLKVFEAMALGCPVVSTAIGVEGLPVQAGTHYLLADEADAMAESVVQLLGDAHTRARLSTAARAYVSEHFSFRSVARDFERICLDTLESFQRKAQRVTA
jgi:glycosyltransferase involved in cell wall biosynthesis